jgi:hypothetical protein
MCEICSNTLNIHRDVQERESARARERVCVCLRIDISTPLLINVFSVCLRIDISFVTRCHCKKNICVNALSIHIKHEMPIQIWYYLCNYQQARTNHGTLHWNSNRCTYMCGVYICGMYICGMYTCK